MFMSLFSDIMQVLIARYMVEEYLNNVTSLMYNYNIPKTLIYISENKNDRCQCVGKIMTKDCLRIYFSANDQSS